MVSLKKTQSAVVLAALHSPWSILPRFFILWLFKSETTTPSKSHYTCYLLHKHCQLFNFGKVTVTKHLLVFLLTINHFCLDLDFPGWILLDPVLWAFLPGSGDVLGVKGEWLQCCLAGAKPSSGRTGAMATTSGIVTSPVLQQSTWLSASFITLQCFWFNNSNRNWLPAP